MPTFLRLCLLCLSPTILHSLLGLQWWLHAFVRVKPVLRRGGAGLLLVPMQVQVIGFLAGEEVVGLILQLLRGTPDHRPQRGGRDLGGDGQLDRQGVHLLLGLSVVTVTGGGLCHQSNQEERDEASQSCDRRDGAGRKGEGERMREGGVTGQLSEKMHCPRPPCTTSTA